MRFTSATCPDDEGSDGDGTGFDDKIADQAVPMSGPKISDTGSSKWYFLKVEWTGLLEISQTKLPVIGEVGQEAIGRLEAKEENPAQAPRQVDRCPDKHTPNQGHDPGLVPLHDRVAL